MSLHNKSLLVVVPVVVLLTACSAYPRTEAEFGNAVRHMNSVQAVNTGPVDPNAVETGDGERLNGVLEAYRSDVTREAQLPQPVVVGFGAGASQ